MARKSRPIRFTKPGRYIFNMILFLLAVGGVVYYVSPYGPGRSDLLIESFQANIALNGLIIFIIIIGIVYNIGLAGVISPAARWIEAYQEAIDASRMRLPRAPALIGAVVKPLLDAEGRGGTISQDTARAMLDSVGTRMDEGRDLGSYIGNLLVFLGLLGTFWGLLQTVNAVGDTISSLATEGGAAEDAISQLIENLKEPLSGMGTAFSSSLFGLGGSLIIGFLGLQAGTAQNRFYADLEDWLSGMVTGSVVGSGDTARFGSVRDNGELLAALQSLESSLAANTETQIKAQSGQNTEIKEEIRSLNRTLLRLGSGE